MNILIPFSWLKDFLKTQAHAEKVAEALSLCSLSVEKIHKIKDDSIFEIEVTVNRYDCLSVVGIAREAAAALLGFGTKAKFEAPKIPSFPKLQNPKLNLTVEIKDKTICPRFSAIIIDNVKISPSPTWMSERLEKVGIRSLSNVVDISNYLMIETGQPIHTFDYDKILGAKMIMRLAKPREKITTLDGVTRTLPGGDIVIEDGEGRLIDLCGIMGAENSQIEESTRRVLFFVQAYDPVRIRQTSMSLAHRTEAAIRFERGIDLEGIIPVISQGVKLMKVLCGGETASKLIDIYSKPQKQAIINLDYNFLESMLGIKLPLNKTKQILASLGFEILKSSVKLVKIKVPTWRAQDVSIEEDLIEEIARIYGYYRLPSNLPPLNPSFGLSETPQPVKGKVEPFFEWENKIKGLLKNRGFSEIYNYSFIGQKTIQKLGFETKDHLKLKNPLTSSMEYLRISLLPSLLVTTSKNQTFFPKMKIFEMANVYLHQENDLPKEKPKLTCLVIGEDFYYLKGLSEVIFQEMGIENVSFKQWVGKESYFTKGVTAVIETNKNILGTIGKINSQVLSNFEILNDVFVLDLDFDTLVKLAKVSKTYTSIPKFPSVIEDLAFTVPSKTQIGDLIQLAKSVSSIIKNVELLDSYEDTRTFRITYLHHQKTLADREVKTIREKIIMLMEKKFRAKIKTVNN